MRIVVIGGTRFIGRALVEELLAAGHEPLVVHRGRHEPPDLPAVPHLHVDRLELPQRMAELRRFRPKLDVERAYLERGGTICRLPMVYGDHDYKRREEFILRRVRARRRRIPFGAGCWLWSRCHVRDIAAGLRLALESEPARGEVFNLCEPRCASVRLWAEQILAAAGHDAELVSVPDKALPTDLEITAAIAQHWLATPAKAQTLLAWQPRPTQENVAHSVNWHLDHPPAASDPDFADDERALAVAAQQAGQERPAR